MGLSLRRRRSARRYPRRTVRVRVEFRCRHGLRSEVATTLGAGGLFIATEDPLPPGEVITLRFRLPEASDAHELPGRVVWCKRPEDSGVHGPGMGIEFTSRGAAAALARELDSLEG